MPRTVAHRLFLLWLGITLLLSPRIQSSAAEEAAKQKNQLFVLLRNGEVIRGEVDRDTDHLVVKRSGSVELRIPGKEISFIGANLNSVYENRANQIVEFHADEHLELASWCLQNRLIGPATQHILRAETIQPDHPQTPLLKARLEGFLVTAQKLTDAEDDDEASVAGAGKEESRAEQEEHTVESIPPPTQVAAASRQIPIQPDAADQGAETVPAQYVAANETHETPIIESAVVAPLVAAEELPANLTNATEDATSKIAARDTPEIDLPPELIKAYTARIQPLLLNRCGAGHCHGHATTSKYELHRVPLRRNPPRDVTMRNLAATLEQLDRLHPANSPLLTWGRKPHGQMRSKLLAVSNAKQQQLLADWLTSVASGGPTKSPESTADVKQVVARNTRHRLPRSRRASIQWQEPSRKKTATGAAAAKVSDIKKEDPFDPKSFNVEFAPKTP